LYRVDRGLVEGSQALKVITYIPTFILFGQEYIDKSDNFIRSIETEMIPLTLQS